METEHDDAYDAPRAGGAAAAASTSGPAAAAQGGDAAGAGTTDSATLRSILEEAEAKAELGEDDTVPAPNTDESAAYEENMLSDEDMLKAVNLQVDPDAQLAKDMNFRERARYVPLRLTYNERKYLRLVESALYVSEYTDKVDVWSGWRGDPRTKRMHAQLKEMCAILAGMLVSANYERGQRLIRNKDFAENAGFYRTVFELYRRYSTLNPERTRGSYGKVMFMLQDSHIGRVQELLGFDPVTPLKTVHTILEEKGALQMLDDPLLAAATMEVKDDKTKARGELQEMIRRKNMAVKLLKHKYAGAGLKAEEIETCLCSMSDSSSFLGANRDPVDRMLLFLKDMFHPTEVESEQLSLAISSGRGGARLSHSHARQYTYLYQTLTLWRAILHDFFKLWCLAEEDLLDTANPYSLRDTGQGLNRVQGAPRLRRAMTEILRKTHAECGHWIGSSVVHLGDHNVPNAFMFIDKYTQVARILGPIVRVIDEVGPMCAKDPGVRGYIDSTFGGVERCRKVILADFFRHGFDGSGADNFFDAGSCIDGRLTSAWNWCSRVEKKRFFPVFLLTGFTGFDGEVTKS